MSPSENSRYLPPQDTTADPPGVGPSAAGSGASGSGGDGADVDLDALRERIATAWPDPMDAPPLRWGVLGAGGIARRFAREVPQFSRSRVVAVGSRSTERAQEFAGEFPEAGGEPDGERTAPRAYGSYEELVADPGIDAIYVASPHSEHREHALLAIAAGKHVLVEKAFARSVAEATDMFDAARARGVFVMEAMWARFLPHQWALREVLSSGVLGEVVGVHADHSQRLTHRDRLMKPELAGGALLDMNIYCLSFVHQVLGAPPTPEGVHAHGVLTETGVDGNEVVVLDYRPDRPSTLAVATSSLWGRSRTEAEVIGTAGRLDMRGRFYRPAAAFVVCDNDDNVLLRFPADDAAAEVAGQGGFQHEAAEVAHCVAQGLSQSEIMPWSATLEILGITDEVRRSLGVVFPGE